LDVLFLKNQLVDFKLNFVVVALNHYNIAYSDLMNI